MRDAQDIPEDEYDTIVEGSAKKLVDAVKSSIDEFDIVPELVGGIMVKTGIMMMLGKQPVSQRDKEGVSWTVLQMLSMETKPDSTDLEGYMKQRMEEIAKELAGEGKQEPEEKEEKSG